MLAITFDLDADIKKQLIKPLLDRLRVRRMAKPAVDTIAAFLAQKAQHWQINTQDVCLFRLLVLATHRSFRSCFRVLAAAKAAGALTQELIQTELGLEDSWEEDFLDDEE